MLSEAEALLAEAQAAGFQLRVRDGRILIWPGDQVPPELLERLRAAKPQLLAILSSPAWEYAQTVRWAESSRTAWTGATFELAEALGFPRLQYLPHLAVGAGEACWRYFLASASADIHTLREHVLPKLRALLAAIPGPEEG